MNPMVKINTREADGGALNWAVAISLGYTDVQITGFQDVNEPDHCFFRPGKIAPNGREICGGGIPWDPVNNWAQGGPILFARKISTEELGQGYWNARIFHTAKATGDTPLLAGMRSLVLKEMGLEIEVPAQLVQPGLVIKTPSLTKQNIANPRIGF